MTAQKLTHFIGGKEVSAATPLESRNPSNTNEVIATFPEGTAEDVNAAVEAARKAQPAWAAASPEVRSDILDKAGSLILERKDAIGKLLAREEGKTLPEAIGETARAGRILKYFAGEALRRHGQNLDSGEPGTTIERLARRNGVRVEPAGTYRAGALLKTITPELGAIGELCLSDALDEVEAGPEPMRSAAEGWARGDSRAALAASRGYEKCVNAMPEGADLARRAMNDTTASIERALARPGRAIAIVNLRTLLASDGVLQQLRSQGYAVTTPEQD